jgi:CO/xanthine dehydrogenase Mo-binding subunit
LFRYVRHRPGLTSPTEAAANCRGKEDYRGFQEADVIKEFTYSFAGATAVPMQPVSSVAKWDGDKLTFWGMGQGIYPQRAEIARALKIDPANIRYINKWNGCTFGSVMAASRMQPFIAYIARVAGRPVKIMLTEDQEFAYIAIKPETITKFKVGAKKDGRIVALLHEVHLSARRARRLRPRHNRGFQEQHRTVHIKRSALEIRTVLLQDQCDEHQSRSELHAARDQVGLGKHDR